MRKITVITMMIALLILPISVGSAEGYDYKAGYFDKNQDYTITNDVVIDNDITTHTSISSSRRVIADFEEPKTIKAIYTNFNSYSWIMEFHNEAGVLIHTENFLGASNQGANFEEYREVNIAGVVKMTARRTSTNSTLLKEIELFMDEPIEALPIIDLTQKSTYQGVTLTWVNPGTTYHDATVIMKDGVEIATVSKNSTSHTINGLDPETTYTFDVYAKYNDGSMSTSRSVTAKTSAKPLDTTAPGNITSMSVEVGERTASFVYLLPKDTDFSHLKIYRDNELIEVMHKDSIFQDSGLQPNTQYAYKFVSVDFEGNESNGYLQNITTKEEIDSQPPDQMIINSVVNGSSAGSITYQASIASDLAGYNIYVDGVKHNTTLVKSTSYTITNLQNGRDYAIRVSAVDTSGNESIMSEPRTLRPDITGMPIFETEYTLDDIAQGVSSMFGSMWLIVAFAVSIPLAFLVARRVKSLFLS